MFNKNLAKWFVLLFKEKIFDIVKDRYFKAGVPNLQAQTGTGPLPGRNQAHSRR